VNRLTAASGVGGLTALLLMGLWSVDRIPGPPGASPSRRADAELHARTIARLRSGERYYDAVGTELRSNGYPTQSIFNWRTPLHYELVAILPGNSSAWLVRGLSVLVVLSAIWAFANRVPAMTIAGAFLLFGAVLVPLLGMSAALFGEVWSGLLIGLSLASYYRGRFILAAAAGVLALFMRELAAPYVMVCALLAVKGRRRKEMAAWAIGVAAYAVYYARHALQAMEHSHPTDLSNAAPWVQFPGVPFLLRTLRENGWFLLLPTWVAPVVCVLAVLALFARSAPAQLRGSLIAYVVFFLVVGQPFNDYWGLVTTPIWAYALAHSVEGLRELGRDLRSSGGPHALEPERS
jgi:hypothetical protein